MKARNLFIFLIIFSLLIASTISIEDSCPAGMRKTYVDDLNMVSYGSARKLLASVCYFQLPGSLYFQRKVLIEPRFEVHFKASSGPVDYVESTDEQKIYGFTIVISGYKNTISGMNSRIISGSKVSSSSLQFNDIGYNNFINALIIEFDFVKDTNDPDSNSFSIRYCSSTCGSSSDNNAFGKKKLGNQKFQIGQKNEWDFRFLYQNKNIYVYSGPNTILYSSKYDLESTLDTNIAYVGFTGFMESNRGEINLMGTFICEDNYVLKKMIGYFLKDQTLLPSSEYLPEETINFAFHFINGQTEKIPHTYGYGIWNYSFFATQDCESKSPYYTISKYDNYTLVLTFKACTKAGVHAVTLNEDKKGSGIKSYYYTLPGPLAIITLVGYDGKIVKVPIKSDPDVYYLNYGKSNSGDFILEKNLKIVLDFKITDQYGNKVTVSNPDTLFSLVQVNSDGSTSYVNSNILNYGLLENGNYHQMTINVSASGTYQIEKNDYMDKPIKFTVTTGEANPTNSYCYLEGYSSIPTVDIDTTLNYMCYLRDSNGNEISINSFIQNSQYEFICSLDKSWPSSNSYSPDITNDAFSYKCSYSVSEVGNYAYNGYLKLKTTEETLKITTKLNQFYVRGDPKTYIIKKIMNPSSKEWLDIDTYTNTIIPYVADSKGFITAIDFAEATGDVLISLYDNYPDEFDISNLNVIFSSTHDENFNFGEVEGKLITLDGKNYIGIYTKSGDSTDSLITKSSFNYYLKFTYFYEKKSASIEYLLNIGPYITCFHNLDESKTKVNIDNNIELLTGGEETRIGNIILSTNDNNLYNYDIGTSKIQTSLTPPNNNIVFRVISLSIEGTYDVYAKSTQDYEGDLKIIINDVPVKTIKVISEPSQACYLDWVNPEYFKYQSTSGKEIYYEYVGDFDNGNLLINFKLKDRYNNSVEKEDYFIKYSDISSEEYGKDTEYFSISFESSNKGFKFRDNIPYENKMRGWVFTMREKTCNYKYYLRYDGKKGGSPLDLSNSYYTLLNTEVYINSEVYVDVTYKDKNNQNLGLQEEKLIEAKSKTKVIATNTERHKIELTYDSTTSNYALRYKANFTVSGTYYINATLDNDYLNYENTNQLIVIDNIYDLYSSKFTMIIDIDNIINMRIDKSVTIDNYLYVPFFRLEFYSKDKVKTDYDKRVNFQLVISSLNMSQEIVFNVNKNNDEYIEFNLPDDKVEIFHNLKGGDYDLILTENKNIYTFNLNNKDYINQPYDKFNENENSGLPSSNLMNVKSNLFSDTGNKALTYKVVLLGHVEEDLNKEVDYQKTLITDQNLKFLAGESGYLMIELRTEKDIRCNSSEYEIKVKSCNEEDTTFMATPSKAGVLGVFQVTVTTQKANTYPKKEICRLKIYINDTLVENLNPEMEVSPNQVVETKILEKYYKTNSNVELLDGNADMNYLFEVASYDQYNNLAETKQDTIGLKVTYKGGSEYKTNSENDINTGYRTYILSPTKSGTYIVSTSKSGLKGIYLKNEASFLINPGTIDITKTVIKEKTTPIQAGDKPAISVTAYDRYGNTLEYTNYMNKFNAIFLDHKNQEFNSSPSYDSGIKKVFYTSDNEVTIVGNVKVKVLYDNIENIDASSIIIEVLPGDPYPPYSILSLETNSGIFTEYADGDSFEVDTKEALQLNVTLYDKYKNYVDNLPANAEILEPILSGNKMSSITFTIFKNTGNFDLDFNGVSKYVYIYQHLIKGIYDLTFKVKSSLGEKDFHYYLIVNNGDDLHGNGDYVISKCILKPEEKNFVAGNYEKFTLELRTEEGLLYNDDIDIDKDISIGEVDDTSFKYGISKSGSDYGIYTITIYSEKKGEYYLNIALTDPSSNSGEKRNINQAKYKVTPDPIPDKTKTQITKKPESSIGVDTPIEIQFYLYDKFNNKIEKSDNIVQTSYFSLLNNEEPYSYTSLNFDNRAELHLMPKYPPKTMSLNLLYNNGENTVYIFEKDIVINIETDIDFMKSQIVSSNKEIIYAGDVLDMWIYTYDGGYKCLDNGDYSDKFEIEIIGPLYSSKQYIRTFNVKKTKITEEGSQECNNEYQIDNDPERDPIYKYAGNYLIKVKYDKTNLIGQFNQICYPLGYDIKGFNLIYSFNPDTISILDSPSFTITGTDKYGNQVNDPLYNDIDIKFTYNNNEIEFETIKKTETQKGTLNYQISIKKVGSYQLHILYKGEEVEKVNNFQEDLPIFTILTGSCYAKTNKHFDLSPLNNTEISLKTYFTFQCYDKYNNQIKKGGEKFTVKGEFSTITNQGDIIPFNDVKVVDNEDGSYKVEFVPTMKGIYIFNLLLGKEKYGEEVRFELSTFKCTGEGEILCPNKKLCVKNILECIEPPSNCDISTPFNCTVNGIYTCVKSQTECDCPDETYIKCNITNYCVKKSRKDMCPSFKNVWAICKKNHLVYNFDGICRKNKRGPNQRVCPIGKILCPDLSCRDNHDQCVETEIKTGKKQRCLGQQLVDNAYECPSSITCSTEDEVVCPTGECVSNEIYCPSVNKCNENYPYLCQNNICATEFKACADSISCGENKLLCSDNICRENC